MDYSAIYYPYAGVRSEGFLKRALLLYDHMYLIYPREHQYALNMGFTEEEVLGQLAVTSYEEAEMLVEEGFLKPIDPTWQLEGNEDLFLEMLKSDDENATMRSEVERRRLGPFHLYAMKVPTTIFDELGIQNVANIDVVQMDFVKGESIMLTHALIASGSKALSLVTDDPLHQRFLSMRLEGGLENLGTYGSDFESQYNVTLPQIRARRDFMEKKLLELSVPDLAAEELTDIIEFRQDNRDELVRFKTGIAQLVKRLTELEGLEGSTSFGADVAYLIEDYVRPAYEKLRADSRFSISAFISNIFDKKEEPKTRLDGLALRVFGSLPNWLGLIGRAGYVLSKAAWKEEMRRRRALKENPLAYLLMAEREFA